MAGKLKGLLDSLKFDDEKDEYDDEKVDIFEPDDEFNYLDYSEEPAKPTKRPFSRSNASSKSYDSTLDLDDEEEYTPRKTYRPVRKQQQSNVLPIRKTTGMEVSMARPTTMNDGRDVVETLLSGKAVVINMEGVNFDMAQRIIDFCSGAIYSMRGEIQSISKYIFIIAPNNIELSGDFAGALGGGSESLKVNI